MVETVETPVVVQAPAPAPISFDALMADLEQMHKSLPTEEGNDDDKIEAAAEDGESGEAGEDGDTAEGDTAGKKGKKPTMAKSFTFTTADGEEVEAVDGTELVKSLTARIDANESVIAKALGSAIDLIKAQGVMIKSLGDRVGALANTGRGRRTVLAIAEKPAPAAEELAKSNPGAMGREEFMAKAWSAFQAGKIDGLSISRLESHMNKGLEVPADLAARVLSHK